jgi:hypothetical protein
MNIFHGPIFTSLSNYYICQAMRIYKFCPIGLDTRIHKIEKEKKYHLHRI